MLIILYRDSPDGIVGIDYIGTDTVSSKNKRVSLLIKREVRLKLQQF